MQGKKKKKKDWISKDPIKNAKKTIVKGHATWLETMWSLRNKVVHNDVQMSLLVELHRTTA